MLSSAELLLLSLELDRKLGAGKIQKIHGPTDDVFSFEIYKEEKQRLLISLEPTYFRAHISTEVAENPERPTPFVEKLRAFFQNGRIKSIESLSGERILRIECGVLVESGAEMRRIYVELFPRSRNLIVTDGEDQVLAVYRDPGSQRPNLRVGSRYEPPKRQPDPTRKDPPAFAFLPPGASDLSLALESFVLPKISDASRTAKRDEALVELRRRLRKDRKLLEHLQNDAKEGARAAEFARFGELLKADLGNVPRRAKEVTVLDYSKDPAESVVIPLDPKETPLGTMQRYFKEARKREAAWARASAELGRVEERVVQLGAFEEKLVTSSTEAEVDLVLESALKLGIELIPDPATVSEDKAARKSEPERRKPYRTFKSQDGLEILVGRTAADNDVLTFDIARGGDVWLHVADYPGSHVVVRCEGEIPQETLHDAAYLAAHFSKAPEGSLPTISWTRRKYVKKFKGAHAGQVQLAERKTVRLRRDPARLPSILGREVKSQRK